MNQINQILSAMETGEIKKKNGRPYSKATIKLYKDVMASIDLDLDDPIKSTVRQLESRGAESVTVVNYLAVAKFFLRQLDIKYVDEKIFIDEPSVYIPEPERVWEMLKVYTPGPKQDKVAFAYIMAEALTSARYLDISKWTYANLIKYKGQDYLRYTQSKTGKTIQMPFPQLLRNHIARFKGPGSKLLPEVDYRTLLRNVKLVFKKAGFTNEIQRVRTVAGKTVVEIKQEWELMGTHRLRAAAITGMLQSGMSESEAKKFSGHSPRSNSFHRYVEFSQDHIDNKFLNYINQ